MKLLYNAIGMIWQVQDSWEKAAVTKQLLPGSVLKIPNEAITAHLYFCRLAGEWEHKYLFSFLRVIIYILRGTVDVVAGAGSRCRAEASWHSCSDWRTSGGILSNAYLLSGLVPSPLWLDFCTAWILKVVLHHLLTCICFSNLPLSKCPHGCGTWGHEDNCSNSNTCRGPATMTPSWLSISARISETIDVQVKLASLWEHIFVCS